MLQFTNGFSCAMDREKGELIINFVQQSPIIDENGISDTLKIDEVITLVMGKVMAKDLAKYLNELLETNE